MEVKLYKAADGLEKLVLQETMEEEVIPIDHLNMKITYGLLQLIFHYLLVPNDHGPDTGLLSC